MVKKKHSMNSFVLLNNCEKQKNNNQEHKQYVEEQMSGSRECGMKEGMTIFSIYIYIQFYDFNFFNHVSVSYIQKLNITKKERSIAQIAYRQI